LGRIEDVLNLDDVAVVDDISDHQKILLVVGKVPLEFPDSIKHVALLEEINPRLSVDESAPESVPSHRPAIEIVFACGKAKAGKNPDVLLVVLVLRMKELATSRGVLLSPAFASVTSMTIWPKVSGTLLRMSLSTYKPSARRKAVLVSRRTPTLS
jgi:hypothetical protein